MAQFITDDTLKTLVAAALHNSAASMESYWTTIITRANADAYNGIVAALAERGFTVAQIAAWDRGAEFESAIGTFWALTYGGALDEVDDKLINKLDRREELKTVAITASGVIVDPDSEGSVCGVGPLNTEEDYFVLDPNDPRQGQVTRF